MCYCHLAIAPSNDNTPRQGLSLAICYQLSGFCQMATCLVQSEIRYSRASPVCGTESPFSRHLFVALILPSLLSTSRFCLRTTKAYRYIFLLSIHIRLPLFNHKDKTLTNHGQTCTIICTIRSGGFYEYHYIFCRSLQFGIGNEEGV